MAMEFQGRRSEENSNNTDNGDHGIGKDDPNTSQTPRKLYQRYSPQQVLRMREFYRKNTHPDDNERKALGEELGLDPLRVKFWFQNRRSQNKKRDDNVLNLQLWEENEKLRADNEMLKQAFGYPICKNCGGSSINEISTLRMQHLRTENAFIKGEIRRVTQSMETYFGPGVLSFPLHATISSAQDRNPAGEVIECDE